MKNNPTPAKWEESAEEFIHRALRLPTKDGLVVTKELFELIDTHKSFIHHLLSDYKSRLLSEVEGMKKEFPCEGFNDGETYIYNQGISAAVEVVKKMI